MFIVNLTYVKPLSEVERYLQDHIKYLDKYYAKGSFLCSGRKNPRTGGVILCNAETMEELQQIIKEDPFHKNSIADYEVTEFYPTKCAEGFERFIKSNAY